MIDEPTASRSLNGALPAVAGLLLPIAIVAAGGWFHAQDVEPVQAQASSTEDSDRDGLLDKLETVLGSSPLDADSDRDGFSDLEEYARHSNSVDATFQPRNHEVSVALSAHGGGGYNHLVAAIYSSSGTFHDKQISFGGVLGGRLSWFPLAEVLHQSTIRIHPSRNGARILVIDWPINPSLIRRFGYVSFFAAAGLPAGETRFYSASVVDLESVENIIMLARSAYAFAGSSHSMLAQMAGSGGAGGGFHTPIPPSDNGFPADWTSGAACVQQASTVGASGAVLTQQVTEAGCEDGWDSACSGSCSSSVGSTFQTVDPVTIVGG